MAITKDNLDRMRRIKIIAKIRKLYWDRKPKGLTMAVMAKDIGVSVASLSTTLTSDYATERTLNLFEKYVDKQK